MLGDRSAPLHALQNPVLRNLQHLAATGGAAGGDGETARVQRDQGELQAEAFTPEDVLAGNVDVVELDQHIADAAQAHELAAVRDLDAWRIRLDDERRDLLLLFALDHLRRRLAHHHEKLGLQAVRAPQLLAADEEALAVRRGDGPRGHLGRIGTDARLGQRERRDGAVRQARQPLLLLLVRPEELEGLRYADRLMRREPRHGRAAPRRYQADGAVVVRRAE